MMDGVVVDAAVIRVDKTEREKRQGIATEGRETARAFGASVFGWPEVGTAVEQSQADYFVVRIWRVGA